MCGCGPAESLVKGRGGAGGGGWRGAGVGREGGGGGWGHVASVAKRAPFTLTIIDLHLAKSKKNEIYNQYFK